MLIDSFAEDLALVELDPSLEHYLLIDGAFVPRLHRKVADDRKRLLFEPLPGCTDETKDVSPFLTRLDSAGRKLLQSCDRWPMVSLIETRESLDELSERLSAWCVVEADGDRFNFRFADTRRLPAIYRSLNQTQRGQFAGPAERWRLHRARWPVACVGTLIARALESPQTRHWTKCSSRALSMTAGLMKFSRLLCDSGHDVYRQPSRSHALLDTALRTAAASRLGDDDVMSWCKWFWQAGSISMTLLRQSLALDAWRTSST